MKIQMRIEIRRFEFALFFSSNIAFSSHFIGIKKTANNRGFFYSNSLLSSSHQSFHEDEPRRRHRQRAQKMRRGEREAERVILFEQKHRHFG